jgi:hypothetical protein
MQPATGAFYQQGANLMIEFKHWLTGVVLLRDETATTIREALTRAITDGANLDGAYLDGANLDGAYLDGANLRGANLDGAYLRGAYLGGANLRGANLRGAYLRGAYLGGANLDGAYLGGANLRGANLDGAYLRGAYLGGANLRGANLRGAVFEAVQEDLIEILSHAPREVPGLLAALRAGKVDGSTYEGDCACLVGTIANVRGCAYEKLEGIMPNGSRPAERFFLAIRKGDTPENHPLAKIAEQWIESWMLSNPHVLTPETAP